MRIVRRTAAVLVAMLVVLVWPAAAWAAPGAPATSPAYVRLAHLSPDTPSVDVYVAAVADGTRSFVVPGVGYGALSDYRAVQPGTYVISMRPAGAPATSAAVISTTVDAQPGGAYTIAGVGLFAQLGLTVLRDQLTMPAAGRASVRVINAAATQPKVDIAPQGGPVWASGIGFASQTPYFDVGVGDWVCEVTADGRLLARLPVTLTNNAVYTVLLVDKGAGLQAELHTDSTGSAVVPKGSVETGMGGTADQPNGPWWVAAAVALAGTALTGLIVARRAR